MSAAVGVVLVVWIVILLLIAKSIVRVPADAAYVVKTLGRVNRVLDTGLHLVMPFVSFVSAQISLLEQVLDVPATPATMQDGSRATVRGTIRFRVTDPIRAVSEVANFRTSLTILAANEWTCALADSVPIGGLQAVQAREPTIRTAADAWGIEVLNASPILIFEDDAMSLLDRPGSPSSPPLD